jgi:flagellar biosynthetic protein FliR
MDFSQMGSAASLGLLARVGAVLAVSPPFAGIAVPRSVRAMLAVALTIGLTPTMKSIAPLPQGVGEFWLAIGGEVLIGLAMGLSISLVFAAASWAGDVISNQLGLELSGAYDPRGGSEGSPLGQAYWMLAVVVFLSANGHHALIRGIRASFDSVPVMSAGSGEAIVAMFVGLLQSATVLAVQLAAPVFIATLVADVALGLAGKTIPQLGVLTAGVTMRSLCGLIVLIAGIAMTAGLLQGATLNWTQIVQSMLPAIGK